MRLRFPPCVFFLACGEISDSGLQTFDRVCAECVLPNPDQINPEGQSLKIRVGESKGSQTLEQV